MHISSTFSEEQRSLLQAFLGASSEIDGGMSYAEACGFLFVLSCTDELIPPSEWLPVVWGEDGPDFADHAQAAKITEALMALYNDVLQRTSDENYSRPPGCEARTPAMANVGPEAPLGQWATGFVRGYEWLAFDELLPEDDDSELSQELTGLLLVLAFFATEQGMRNVYDDMTGEQSLEEMAESMLSLQEAAMKEFAEFVAMVDAVTGGSGSGLSLPEPQMPYVAPEKIGRNEPCPCGSGKKYKKCCAQVTLH